MNEQHTKFLCELRDSCRINMFAAVPHLMAEFPELTKAQAKDILLTWMQSC